MCKITLQLFERIEISMPAKALDANIYLTTIIDR